LPLAISFGVRPRGPQLDVHWHAKAEIGGAKISIDEVRVAKSSAAKIGLLERGTGGIRPIGHRAEEVGVSQIGATQVASAEIDPDQNAMP